MEITWYNIAIGVVWVASGIWMARNFLRDECNRHGGLSVADLFFGIVGMIIIPPLIALGGPIFLILIGLEWMLKRIFSRKIRVPFNNPLTKRIIVCRRHK